MIAPNLPTKVKVFALDYEIQIVEELATLGESDSAKQRIRLRAGQGPQQMADTLYHELKHAGFAAVPPFAVVANSTADLTTSEEEVVRADTLVTMTLMRDNPELFRVLAQLLLG